MNFLSNRLSSVVPMTEVSKISPQHPPTPRPCAETTLNPDLLKMVASKLDPDDKGAVAMLRLMIIVIVASDRTDDDLLSECQVCGSTSFVVAPVY